MIDLVIVLVFIAYAINTGFRARRTASASLQEYFLAGKTLSGTRAGVSMAATQFAADTPLLVVGLVATGGIFMVWRLWVYGIAFLMMGLILARCWRRAGVLTDAELTEVRYSGKGVLLLRGLKAIYYGTIINCVVMAMVMIAATRIAEVFLPWHEWLPAGLYGVIQRGVTTIGLYLGESVSGLPPAIYTTNSLISGVLILAFTALYSTTGGLRSVVATDIMQFTLAMLGSAAYAGIIVWEVGGLGALSDRLATLYGAERAAGMLSFSPRFEDALMPFLVVISLQWLFQMNSDGTGYLAQRSMACRTDADARTAAVVFAWLQIVLRSLIWIVIGLGLLILYPFSPENAVDETFTASREILFVQGIEDYLPAGIRGLMLTGLLAALASTLDTHLNWGASYWSNDVYKRILCERLLDRQPKTRELVLAARLSNLLVLSIAVVIMANLGSIRTAWTISLLFGAGMGSVLVLRWLWERINLYSELAAMTTSIVAAPIILFNVREEWLGLSIMALVTTIAAVGVTFLSPSTHIERLKDFYRTVEPAGFWKNTAIALNQPPSESRARLLTGVRQLLFASLSLFLALVGAGKLLVRMPGDGIVLPILLLLAAIASTPLWSERAGASVASGREWFSRFSS